MKLFKCLQSVTLVLFALASCVFADIAPLTETDVPTELVKEYGIAVQSGETRDLGFRFTRYGTPIPLSNVTTVVMAYQTPASTNVYVLDGYVYSATGSVIYVRWASTNGTPQGRYRYVVSATEPTNVVLASARGYLSVAPPISGNTTNPAPVWYLDSEIAEVESNLTAALNAHLSDYANPHQVTAAQVGAMATADYVQGDEDNTNKVDTAINADKVGGYTAEQLVSAQLTYYIWGSVAGTFTNPASKLAQLTSPAGQPVWTSTVANVTNGQLMGYANVKTNEMPRILHDGMVRGHATIWHNGNVQPRTMRCNLAIYESDQTTLVARYYGSPATVPNSYSHIDFDISVTNETILTDSNRIVVMYFEALSGWLGTETITVLSQNGELTYVQLAGSASGVYATQTDLNSANTRISEIAPVASNAYTAGTNALAIALALEAEGFTDSAAVTSIIAGVASTGTYHYATTAGGLESGDATYQFSLSPAGVFSIVKTTNTVTAIVTDKDTFGPDIGSVFSIFNWDEAQSAWVGTYDVWYLLIKENAPLTNSPIQNIIGARVFGGVPENYFDGSGDLPITMDGYGAYAGDSLSVAWVYNTTTSTYDLASFSTNGHKHAIADVTNYVVPSLQSVLDSGNTATNKATLIGGLTTSNRVSVYAPSVNTWTDRALTIYHPTDPASGYWGFYPLDTYQLGFVSGGGLSPFAINGYGMDFSAYGTIGFGSAGAGTSDIRIDRSATKTLRISNNGTENGTAALLVSGTITATNVITAGLLVTNGGSTATVPMQLKGGKYNGSDSFEYIKIDGPSGEVPISIYHNSFDGIEFRGGKVGIHGTLYVLGTTILRGDTEAWSYGANSIGTAAKPFGTVHALSYQTAGNGITNFASVINDRTNEVPTCAAVSNAIHRDIRWTDILIPGFTFGGGVTAPQRVSTGTVGGMEGMGWDAGDIGFASVQMPHNLAITNFTGPGTNLVVYPHLHISAPAAPDGTKSNVAFKMTYEWANIGSNFISSAVTGTLQRTFGLIAAGQSEIMSLGAITNNSAGISSIFRMRLERVNSGADDYDTGDNRVILDSGDIHCPVMGFGSRYETAP